MLRFLDAGETHGKCLVAIVEGLPSNLTVNVDKINEKLALRQGGHGRGGRMKIESDRVEILTGVRGGKTLGSPVALRIENRDYKNWEKIMGALEANDERAVYVARPGHADLTGAIKYDHADMRNVLERASARETAIRTAVGALCMCLLEELGITVTGRVVRVADAVDNTPYTVADLKEKIAASDMRIYDAETEKRAIDLIDAAREAGESLGGVVEIVAEGVMPGLGSYVHYDRKLDAALAGALMSVQAIKGVEVGMGFEAASVGGSKVHDPIVYNDGYTRLTNNAGGIEGGMSNGETIVLRAAMKPIPTLYTPLQSVDIRTKEKVLATVERSDVCAISACSIVCEGVVAFELAKAVLDRYAADNMTQLKRSISND